MCTATAQSNVATGATEVIIHISQSQYLSYWKVSSAISLRRVGCGVHLLLDKASFTRFSHSSLVVRFVTSSSARVLSLSIFIL